MKTIKGPAIFLAQFAGDTAPFNSLDAIGKWAAGLGSTRACRCRAGTADLFDLKNAAESKTYCEEVKGALAQHGLEITELSTHLQGQLVAVHPAYDAGFDGFAAPEVRGNPEARQKWAVQQMLYAAKASQNLGLTAHASFSGALAWPYLYSWPPRPPGLIEEAFDELARRWRPILDAFDAAGVDVCYEIHPGEDLHDGVSYEMFLDRVGHHQRACLLYDPSHFVLQQLNYLDYIDHYHDRIKIFHVKDAEFNPTGKQGVYGGFQSWLNRAGRFRSLGDGQVDFAAIFSKMAAYDFPGWAVLEWECCIKHPEDGAREGAKFIAEHIIRVAERAFDDFAAGGVDTAAQQEDARHRLNGTRRHDDRRNTSTAAARRIRLGMVGGGQGAFIGGVHRMAARIDDRYELVAGALSSDAARAAASAAELHIAPERSYADYTEMARAEAARKDGIDVVAIVTPNHLHGRIASAFLDAGIDVICDKPLTTTLEEARTLVMKVRAAAGSSPSPTTTAATRWCGRRARWSPPASSARSASCRSSTRRTGSAPTSRPPARSRRRGGSTRRRPVPAARSATSARTPSSSHVT